MINKDKSKFTALYGLIGYPLSHSFSKRYFSQKFEKEGIEGHDYDLFPLTQIDQLPNLIVQYPNLKGLNVTIPYKELVFDYLDEVDEAAAEVGAVNTIKISDGRLKGYNTDVYGFEQSLVKWLKPLPAKAMILGTGGAAKAVAYVLRRLGIDFLKISRGNKGDLTYGALNVQHLADYPLVINTTPLGMSPQIDTCPDLPYFHLAESNVLYDLVYNPEKTLFLKRGQEQNCQVKNGLEMLYLQAEKAWEIWNSIDRPKNL
ncbi:MAG: shikimate dehydrogenase [Bacteroidota bacterium]